jgi:hypothetical protein
MRTLAFVCMMSLATLACGVVKPVDVTTSPCVLGTSQLGHCKLMH